jgi:hypothetical protein
MNIMRLKRLMPLLVTGCFAAACNSGYDVTLKVTDAVNAGCDTSCVRSVAVEAFGPQDGRFQCIRNVTMKSLREHGLDGQVDLEVPSSLRGIRVNGWRGEGCADVPVFEGIQKTDGASVSVAVRCIASCKSSTTLQLQATNVLAVAQGKCDPGGATTASAGVLSATHYDAIIPDAATSFLPPTEFSGNYPPTALTGGGASLPGIITTGAAGSCSAVMLLKDGAPVSVACTRFSAPGVCGADNTKTEVATYAAAPLAALDPDGYRTVAVFAMRNGTTPTPIMDAVAAADPTGPKARIEYLELITTGATPELRANPALTKTGPSGAFAVYAREPVQITVTAAGKRSTRMVGGGTFYGETSNILLGGAQIFTPD